MAVAGCWMPDRLLDRIRWWRVKTAERESAADLQKSHQIFFGAAPSMNLTTDEMIHQDTTRRAVRSNHSQVMNHHHYNMYYTVQRFMLARVKFKYEVNKHRSQYSSLNAAPSMIVGTERALNAALKNEALIILIMMGWLVEDPRRFAEDRSIDHCDHDWLVVVSLCWYFG